MFPALMPYLVSGCKTALGMSWKSGIAAEVIGIPDTSIGEQLYYSKLYLDTAGLFAWTFVIVVVSAVFEQLFLFLLKRFWRQPGTASGRCGSMIIRLNDLTKIYNHQRILDRLNLTFTDEAPCCLMGPSGSGKTTLLRILLGLEQGRTAALTLSPAGTEAI